MAQLEAIIEWGGTKKSIISLFFSGIALFISIFNPTLLPFDTAWIAIALCGIPIILQAIIGLVTAFDIKADVLVSLALMASVIIGETFAAGEVAFIMQIGALLENLTVAKARAEIEKLVHMTPHTARKIVNGNEQMIPAEQVQAGDLLRVLPGEMIPADGIIQTGITSINQAVMTGESLPADKRPGDDVFSGTVNQFGSFDMAASKAGENSSIQRMIRLVQSADAGKAKIVSQADRWATWIVVIALISAVLTWLLTSQIIRAVTILVVFCPCALVLATPAAIMAAIGNATKHGFLVSEGDALEKLAGVTRITFDKTGTLTHGTPQVVAVQSFSPDNAAADIYALAACAESRSEHPLGKAVLQCYRAEYPARAILPVEQFQMLPGRGASASINGNTVLAGNAELLQEHRIFLPEQGVQAAQPYMDDGCTIIYIAADRQALGFLALSDTLRQEAGSMIEQIKKAGVTPVLLTGDHANAAKYIADVLGIDEVYANCLPEDKLNRIDHYQQNRQPVCMIGDGINDAPALKKARVGIAMGGIGSDIAIDAADIVLVNDDIKALPHLLHLSKQMMLTIQYNLTFSMALNFIAIILAMTGLLNPVVGALVHNAGSVAVIINSAFLLRWKKNQ